MIRLPIAVVALAAAPAAAEVVQSSPAGFEVKHTVTVAMPPEKAWATVVAPRLWWNKDHTYSDDAANLTLDERPGGCFCEKLPGKGGVEHMRVVYIQPPRMVRMVGALGPLQAEAADGTMSITLTKSGAGSTITMTYVAGGYIRAGADKLAPVVDRVLGQQLAGLQAALEGKPSAAAAPAPRIEAEPLAEVGATISGLPAETAGAGAAPADTPPAGATPATMPPVQVPPKPRPADQDSPR